MDHSPEELARKIEEARAREARERPQPGKAPTEADSGGGRALGAAADLTGGVLVGAFLGYWIDRWLHTNPWGMIVLLFLGFGAGLVNIQRSESGRSYKVGYKDKNKKVGE
jgi:ATP synthase protein I